MSSDLLSVAIKGSIDELRNIASTRRYDFGCKPCAIPTDEGDYMMLAFLTQAQYDDLTGGVTSVSASTTASASVGIRVDILIEGVTEDRAANVTIGQGDRFNGGQIAPQGLGSRADQSSDLGGIMNIDEIGSAISGLANVYSIGTFSLPDPTAEGTGTVGGFVGGSFSGDCHVYFTAGVHARERGGPDSLIYFIGDLLFAQQNGTGLTYGAKSYTNDQVLRALSTGIAFIPVVNPDGVRYDQSTDSVWRKNRNPASAVAGDDSTIGVDINRNYDFLFDFSHFASTVQPASGDPADETFHGQFEFSEPETRNVASVFDTFPSIRWYVDIHSHAATMYYSWGDDDNQATISSQNFRDPNFDGQRGILGAADYQEYIDSTDLANFQFVTDRVTSAMNAVAGNSYAPSQATGAHATSGTSSDYAYSRFQVDSSKNKVYGFTLEFGTREHFYPSLAEFQQNVLDTCAGLMEFCLAAADIGLV